MRIYFLLFALLASPACMAEGTRWYVVNKAGGCETLAEGHEQLPSLSGNWTPDGLLKVMREHYPDAVLAPLLDASAGDKKKAVKSPPSGKVASGKDAPANVAPTNVAPTGDDARQKFFTPANALMLTANDGHIEITMYDWTLCSTLGVLPAGPDRWLSGRALPGDVFSGGTEIPRASWFEVNEESIKDAVGTLREKSLAGIAESWAVYIADRSYMPEPGKHTYLVRGIRTDRAGSHRLVLRDGVLYVIFQSAEMDDNLGYAPLVVNLAAAPDSVVVVLQQSIKY